MKKIRILVAEDHAIVREGTCRVLQQEPDFEVVAEAGTDEENSKNSAEAEVEAEAESSTAEAEEAPAAD